MTGRMESVETPAQSKPSSNAQRRGFSHPSHRPLEIAHAIPTVPQPQRRRFSPINKGAFLRGYRGGHFYRATEGDISIGR